MRLIDADFVYELHGNYPTFARSCADLTDLRDILDDAPTIDPESLRPQGEWECEHETWGKMQCSVCKKEALLEKANGDIGQIFLYVTSSYCPNCGAKMKGGNT